MIDSESENFQIASNDSSMTFTDINSSHEVI